MKREEVVLLLDVVKEEVVVPICLRLRVCLVVSSWMERRWIAGRLGAEEAAWAVPGRRGEMSESSFILELCIILARVGWWLNRVEEVEVLPCAFPGAVVLENRPGRRLGLWEWECSEGTEVGALKGASAERRRGEPEFVAYGRWFGAGDIIMSTSQGEGGFLPVASELVGRGCVRSPPTGMLWVCWATTAGSMGLFLCSRAARRRWTSSSTSLGSWAAISIATRF